ncbi:menaquinone reductase, molybdopterin-binding-like subunit [Nitrospira sp.]|nr:menaquinone reductase, molybdopterin-binding-like subunit [Nitrospira sp.]
MDMKRRTWLKTAVAAAAAAAMPGCKPSAHKLVPYLLPDDEIVPGVADWYASTCQECPAGCGVLVRTMEGRAKKLEGNPIHPVNQGKLCARGQAAVQGLYHPDRLRDAMFRPRHATDASFTPIAFDDALNSILEQIRTAPGRVVILSKPLSGTLGDLLEDFIHVAKGELYWFDPGAEMPLRSAIRHGYGTDTLPLYDLAQADLLVSFGAPFLEHWLSPVSYGVAYGRMRQGRDSIRGRFIHIEPRLSLTAANADRWIPIKPGMEGLLAIALGHVVMTEAPNRLPAASLEAFARLYGAVDVEQIERITDVPRNDIVKLGRELATARHPLILGGGTACAHTNATPTLEAINGLNALLGNVGRPGGLQLYEPSGALNPAPGARWLTERTVLDLVSQFERGERTVLLLNECNPLHAIPPSLGLDRLFDHAAFIASLGPFLDESASRADVVCPAHAWLESWGDHVVPGGVAVQTIGLLQPVVRPLYDNTRALGDSILQLGRSLDQDRFPWPDFPTLLRERTAARAQVASTAEAEAHWTDHLQQGGWWSAAATPVSIQRPRAPESLDLPRFEGDPHDYPFYFYPYVSTTVGLDGAHLPWLQELPDTLTTAAWGAWVEINPQTATRYGIEQGQLVRIRSTVGMLDVPAVLFPGIRPDVVAMPIGQGHATYGRYASGRGRNPLHLIAPIFDEISGALARGATRVQIEPLAGRSSLVLIQEPAVDRPGLIGIDRAARH